MKKHIYPIILFVFFATPLSACVVSPCDLSVTYAISKQKEVLSNRLDELKRVIHALAEGSLYMANLHAKEVRELLRLRERMKIENLTVYEIDFYSKILKQIEVTKKIRQEGITRDEKN